jgi:hypothetical protein
MGGADSAIVQAMLEHQLDLLRLEAGTRARVVGMLNRLQVELIGRLAASRVTSFTKARVNELLRESGVAVDTYFARIEGEVSTALDGVAQSSARQAADTLTEVLSIDAGAGLPTATYLERISSNALVMGAPSSEWWSRQSADTAFRFSNAIRQGLVAGDTNEEIVARVAGRMGFPGIMDVSRANARSLIHTSIQEVANESRAETYRKNADVVEGIRQVSTLDGNTTDICIAYDGAEWTLDGEPMEGTSLPYEGGCPRHWGCRSVEVPITKSFEELGIPAPEPAPAERAAAGGPVPASTTFEEFLAGRTVEQQDEQLGVGRAELWRDGTITLQQLLDLRGNPLTLEELRSKYG